MHQHRSSPQNAVTVTMTTRIFIEDGKTYKTVQLTNLLTAAMVIQYLKRKELLDNNDDWTIFEIANSHGIGIYINNKMSFFILHIVYL